MIDYVSLSVAVAAIIVAVFAWWESHKQNELLGSMAKSLAFIAKSKSKGRGRKVAPAQPLAIQQQREETRRLKQELEREKHEWQKQKDFAKAIGWIIDRLDEEDEE